jgi:hypothetical protein
VGFPALWKSVFSPYNKLGERDIIDVGKSLDVSNAKAFSEGAAFETSHRLATVGGFGYADETVNQTRHTSWGRSSVVEQRPFKPSHCNPQIQQNH